MNAKKGSFLQLDEALVTWALQDYPYSVITKEKLSEQIFIFYMTKQYRNERIGLIRKEYASFQDYQDYISRAERTGILVSLNENRKHYPMHLAGHLENIYAIKGKPEYDPFELVCAIYPYGYLSKLNAMSWYGLTDKIPKVVRLTTCLPAEWKRRSIEDIEIDASIDFEPIHFLPKFPKSTNVLDYELVVSTETHYTEPVNVKDSPLRYATIGKTFVDMLRFPNECGGIDHVLEIYQDVGKKYLHPILAELKGQGSRKIDRARTGFVLQKMVGISHPLLSEWQQESQKTRGSSKILVPGEPFSPIFDEDWSLSLNAESAQPYGNRH